MSDRYVGFPRTAAANGRLAGLGVRSDLGRVTGVGQVGALGRYTEVLFQYAVGGSLDTATFARASAATFQTVN